MMKKLLYFLLIIILTGCSKKENAVISDRINEALPLTLSYNEIYGIYTKTSDFNPAKYEPAEGCYLGAYILSDKRVAFNIGNFEKMTGKAHCIYNYHISPENDFPLKWFMECISKNKTPFFILTADIDNGYELTENFASSLGKYRLPVFIEINPYSEDKGYTEAEYIDFFRNASDIIRRNAPYAAILWGTDIKSVYTADKFYPGDSYIDWTALSIFEKPDADNTLTVYSAELDYFYMNYQCRKPIFISQFCVSHFTSSGHEYLNKNAAYEIKSFYSALIKKYPRIKGISYMDFNAFEVSAENESKDDFCITDAPDILDAYSSAVNDEKYLSLLSISDNPEVLSIKTPYVAYSTGEGIYISSNAVKALWSVHTDKSYMSIIDREECYPIDYIASLLNKNTVLKNGNIYFE